MGYSSWGHKECDVTEQLKIQHTFYVEMGCISPMPPHPQQRNDFASSSFPTTGLPRWLSGKEFACNAGDAGSVPGLGRSPWGEKEMAAHSSILAWENPTGQRSLEGLQSMGSQKNQTRLSKTTTSHYTLLFPSTLSPNSESES